jgi:hypothetical protein
MRRSLLGDKSHFIRHFESRTFISFHPNYDRTISVTGAFLSALQASNKFLLPICSNEIA